MERLVARVNETVVLSIWDGESPVVVRVEDNTDRLVRIIVRTGARMLDRLRAAERLDAVLEVRGVGLMLGVELEPDRDAGPVARRALERGVVARASGQKIVLSPPLVIEDEQADKVVDVLLRSLEEL